jgi:hypothetical protein
VGSCCAPRRLAPTSSVTEPPDGVTATTDSWEPPPAEPTLRVPPPPRSSERGDWWWVPGAITVITIASVIVVTLSQLHPSLLFSDTTTTGGDTGAHIAMPKYLETLITHGHLTGWFPGWYDGMPLYTFYFTIPDLFIAVGGWVIPYDIAFKMGTILGSVLLPVCAWACGRFFRLRPPLPTLLAAATLPFLFDYTFTIYGGNLFSTLAGEYSYSFSLSLAILFLGLFACAIKEGRYRGWAALVLAGCVLSHIVGGMYALGGAVILTALEMLPARWGIADKGLHLWSGDPEAVQVPRRRTLWWAGSTVAIGLLLTAWWLVPFGLEHAYSTSMGYQNVEGWALYFREADAWALVLAGLGVVTALAVRSRFGITVTILGIASALATALDPQGSLYNVRLLPLWFISVYLMAAWTFGTVCIVAARAWRQARLRRWEEEETEARWLEHPPAHAAPPEPGTAGRAARAAKTASERRRPVYRFGPAAIGGAVVGLVAVMVAVVPPFVVPASSLPVTVGPNQVTNWSSYNYEGYEGQASYPEYRAVMETMQSVSKRYGCGRAMWEYSESENRFGTPESLMLLPYWTNGCVASMEGLLFESSTTTPYHFINQAELSAGPSEPEVGLPYGPVNVTLGVQHLQMLGVKYFMAETPTVERQADADPSLKLVATTGPWTSAYNGTLAHTTWKVYLVKNSPLVVPLKNEPVVLSGVKPAPSSWLTPSVQWYDDPSRWNVVLAQSGPTSWPRTPVERIRPTVKAVPTTTVTQVSQTDSSVRFHVSRTGTPVLVKVSYFPNWHASGAEGPWRVTPNLMVVIPTSHDVTLTYGTTGADTLGLLATVVGVAALVVVCVVPWARRRWGGRGGEPGPESRSVALDQGAPSP